MDVLRLYSLPSKVMRRLFWSFDPVMNSVHPSEAWVQKLRGQMEEALRRSIAALHDYAKMFERFLPFLKLEVVEYMKEVRGEQTMGRGRRGQWGGGGGGGMKRVYIGMSRCMSHYMCLCGYASYGSLRVCI